MQPTRILQGMRYRKLRLTTKDVNKGYYKGTGTGSMGRHTKYGTYVIEWEKVRTYVVPPLEGFKLTPFVANTIQRVYGQYETKAGPRDPELYLQNWKVQNGMD